MKRFTPKLQFCDLTTEGAREYLDMIKPLIKQAIEYEEKYGSYETNLKGNE